VLQISFVSEEFSGQQKAGLSFYLNENIS